MKIHFISIGGSVMHQLAIALKNKGYEVTGTDDEIFEPSRTNLEKAGILPSQQGWQPELIASDLDAVILGMHARDDNPELIRAKELKLPIYSFPEYIFQESKDKTRVVIGGSHGKTTTTAMIMHVLQYAEKSFDYLVGAKLEGFQQSVNISSAPVIVCEGDEYPASAIEKKPKFHFLFPDIAVLTGIAWDHINIFPTFDNYLEQFRIFIKKIMAGGHLIFNETDTVLNDLVNENRRSDLTYHPYKVPDHEIKEGVTTVSIMGESTSLKVFGNHNLLNLNAAWLVSQQLGLKPAQFMKGMGSFAGASKRLELLGRNESTIVYRDFAHAPSKVKATIEAVKQQLPEKKFVAILELHTYSSLNEAFLSEYQGAMDKADDAIVFYSQHALEIKRMPPLPANVVQAGFVKHGLRVFTKRQELTDWLTKQDFSNSVIVFMSSGNYEGFDVIKFGEDLSKHDN